LYERKENIYLVQFKVEGFGGQKDAREDDDGNDNDAGNGDDNGTEELEHDLN
jgi:hypothetical protein